MNGWIAAGTALLLCSAVPAAFGAATDRVRRRVPAQNLTATLVALAVLLLSRGYDRSAYQDLALTLAVHGSPGRCCTCGCWRTSWPPRPRARARSG